MTSESDKQVEALLLCRRAVILQLIYGSSTNAKHIRNYFREIDIDSTFQIDTVYHSSFIHGGILLDPMHLIFHRGVCEILFFVVIFGRKFSQDQAMVGD